MSHPSAQPPVVEAQVSDADTRHQGGSLEQQLKAMNLKEPEPTSEVQQERRKKPSARDFLEKLNRRRLEITRINFPASSVQASKGSHGEVVVASLAPEDGSSSEPGDQIAVKKFILSDHVDEEKFLRTFVNELYILDRLGHENIIEIFGFVEDMKRCIAWLVFPWEANGNVREFLLSGKWELPERISLIKDVTSGLEYLHSRQPPVRHGDLKSLNILVNAVHRAIITDFGSARILTEDRGSESISGSSRRQAASTNSNLTPHDESPLAVTVSMTGAQLTLTGPSWSFRWAAPEILDEEEPCLASDIWALGWIAWEIVTDNYPFPEAKTSKAITVKVIRGLLPSLYDDSQLSQIGDLCYVMVRCWKSEPKERLSAAEFQSALRWIPSAIPRSRSNSVSQNQSAALLVHMGDMYRLKDRYEEALKLSEEGFVVAQSAGDKEMMAYALSLAANVHQLLSHTAEAEETCNRSLAIYASIGDTVGQAHALLTLAGILKSRCDYIKAEESLNSALLFYAVNGNNRGVANSLYTLGQVNRERSRPAKAEESFNQSLAISTSIGDALGQATAILGLGESRQGQSKYAEAEESFNQALAIFTSIGDHLGQANASEDSD